MQKLLKGTYCNKIMSNKKFLVCIDSDGCAFDAMELKHKECFCPAYIKHFRLQAIAKYARDAWNFVNLYSSTRGIHRLLALLKAFDLLEKREAVKERNFTPPAMKELRQYVADGKLLSNAGLEEYLKEHPESEEIRATLNWSLEVDERIADMVHGVPSFPHVRESLERLSKEADIVIVSATQRLALKREWSEDGLLPLVTAVKGQESGNKKQIIASLKDEYAPGHVLMIGDAPGDLDAAHANGALFYPICPNEEVRSWARFGECIEAFLSERYAGEMEEKNIAYFNTLLPEEPSWK